MLALSDKAQGALGKSPEIYQINVALRDIRPLIWRRLQVPADLNLPKPHLILQISMGWEDCHLHEFRSQGQAYAEPDPEDDHFGRDIADERRVKLSKLLASVGSSCEYIYDFGDNWQHDILLEAILPVKPRKFYPVCLGGARSAPPEDVGGTMGYQHYLEALFDMRHEDHRAMLIGRAASIPNISPSPASIEICGRRSLLQWSYARKRARHVRRRTWSPPPSRRNSTRLSVPSCVRERSPRKSASG